MQPLQKCIHGSLGTFAESLGSAKHTLGTSDIGHTVSIVTHFQAEKKHRSFRVVTNDYRFLRLRRYKSVDSNIVFYCWQQLSESSLTITEIQLKNVVGPRCFSCTAPHNQNCQREKTSEVITCTYCRFSNTVDLRMIWMLTKHAFRDIYQCRPPKGITLLYGRCALCPMLRRT